MSNYCIENYTRNPETERVIFDILHYALLTAETAVKIMKQKQRNEEKDEKMRALEGISISGQVALDSAEGEIRLDEALPVKASKPNFVAFLVYFRESFFDCL